MLHERKQARVLWNEHTEYSIFTYSPDEAREIIRSGEPARKAINVVASNAEGFVGDASLGFISWFDNGLFIANGLISTSQRGFARSLITLLSEETRQYAISHNLAILHRASFLTAMGGKTKLPHIYADLGYVRCTDPGEGDLERLYP